MIKCPVCNEFNFERDASYEICGVCRWENDPLQYDDHDDDMGANPMSVNQARVQWHAHHTITTKTA